MVAALLCLVHMRHVRCICATVPAGGMLEEHKRAQVPTALYCLLASYCLEAAALVFYTAVFFQVTKGQTTLCYTAEELARWVGCQVQVGTWLPAGSCQVNASIHTGAACRQW